MLNWWLLFKRSSVLEKVLKAQQESEKINFHSPVLLVKLCVIIVVINGKEMKWFIMSDIQKYYEDTENASPHPMIKKIINMKIKPEKAIDLGCGAGRDTIYLI